MSRFLLNSYDILTEIALWLLFAGAVVAGYSIAGIGGVIGFVVGAFIISVFLVAPFMMISDIRKTVSRIEAHRTPHAASSSISNAQIQPDASARTDESLPKNNNGTGHIKKYKGYEITRRDGDVYVDQKMFSNVLEAEAWINDQVKS